jgi:integrase
MFYRKSYNKVRDKDKQRRIMGWLKGRPNTIKVKQSLFDNWVKPFLKSDGSDLDTAVQHWENNLEPNTTKSLLYIAKAWVKDEKGIDLDVRDHISRVSRSKQENPVLTLTREEIVKLKATCEAEDEDMYLALMLALCTGMRRGEVFGLQWQDIDLIKGRLTVSRSYDGPTKTGKSRLVPVSSELEELLLARCPLKSYNRSSRLVCVTFDPNPRLRRMARKAGIREDFTFHTLRHTFATLALEAGRSPKLVSTTLGHASLATTLNIYWNSSGESLDLGFLDE